MQLRGRRPGPERRGGGRQRRYQGRKNGGPEGARRAGPARSGGGIGRVGVREGRRGAQRAPGGLDRPGAEGDRQGRCQGRKKG